LHTLLPPPPLLFLPLSAAPSSFESLHGGFIYSDFNFNAFVGTCASSSLLT
jgi:hypothetical protein